MVFNSLKSLGTSWLAKLLLITLATPWAYGAYGSNDSTLWRASSKLEFTGAQLETNNTKSNDKVLGYRLMLNRRNSNANHTLHLQGRFRNTVGAATALVPQNRYHIADLTTQDNHSAVTIDRMTTSFYTDTSSWVFGRQAISLGQSYFWNPLNLTQNTALNQLDSQYARGIDAINSELQLSNGQFRTILALGKYHQDVDVSWRGSALIGRYTSYWNTTEWALQAGKVYGGYRFGGGLSGDINGIAYRLEGSRFIAQTGTVYTRNFNSLVLGTGHQFNADFNVDLEYLYNGAGEQMPDASTLLAVQQGISPQHNRNLLGLSANYLVSPLLSGSVVYLQAINDASNYITLGLDYSLSDEANITVLTARSAGKTETEFGALGKLFSLSYRTYY